MGGDTTSKVPYTTLRYYLAEWDLELVLVRTPNMRDPKQAWFSVRRMCDQLGLDPTRQRDRICSDSKFAGYWHEIPVETSRGDRTSLCLRVEKIGTWFIIINTLKMNERYRGKLQALQEDIEYKAAEAILGEAARHLLPPRPGRPGREDDKLVSVARGEWHFPCPVCGTPLCMTTDGTHPPHVVAGHEVES
jgi:hypothetical protein